MVTIIWNRLCLPGMRLYQFLLRHVIAFARLEFYWEYNIVVWHEGMIGYLYVWWVGDIARKGLCRMWQMKFIN